MTKPFDQAFKALADEDPTGLLWVVGEIKPGEQAVIKALPREISVSALLPDQAYQVTVGDETWVVHVESQTVYDVNLPERMMGYAVRLWSKYRLPIKSYALILTDRRPVREPDGPVSVSAGHLDISLSYHQVCLWKLSGEEALRWERDSLVPFIPLMHGDQRVLEAGARRLALVPTPTRRQELSLHFLMLGGLRYNLNDLLDLIGRETMIPIEQLKESSFYQYILREGREEGRAEGRAEGGASLLLGLIQRRFGDVSDDVVQKIKRADAETLVDWAARVSTASSLEEVFGK